MSLRVFLALVVFIALGVWQFLEPRPLDGRTLLSIVLGGYVATKTLKEQAIIDQCDIVRAELAKKEANK